MADLIGYWFRFGTAGSKRLHLTKYKATPDGGLEFESACGAPVLAQTIQVEAGLLILPKTAADALNLADTNQRSLLCPRCARPRPAAA